MASNDYLNAVKSVIIDFANNNNIDLMAEFGSVANFKNWVISFAIKYAIDNGFDATTAIDMVLGNGTTDQIVSDIITARQAA